MRPVKLDCDASSAGKFNHHIGVCDLPALGFATGNITTYRMSRIHKFTGQPSVEFITGGEQRSVVGTFGVERVAVIRRRTGSVKMPLPYMCRRF